MSSWTCVAASMSEKFWEPVLGICRSGSRAVLSSFRRRSCINLHILGPALHCEHRGSEMGIDDLLDVELGKEGAVGLASLITSLKLPPDVLGTCRITTPSLRLPFTW